MPRLTVHSGSDEPRRLPILIPPRVWDDLDGFDKNLQSKFIRAFRHISRDLHHPSLQIELVRVGKGAVYRVRADLQHRIHFEARSDCYFILEIGGHRLQGIG